MSQQTAVAVLAVLLVVVTILAAVFITLWATCTGCNGSTNYAEVCNELIARDVPAAYLQTCSALTPSNTPAGYKAVEYGKRVSGSMIGHQDNSTVAACAALCDANDQCSAIYFDNDTQRCQLVDYMGISSSDVGAVNYARASYVATNKTDNNE